MPITLSSARFFLIVRTQTDADVNQTHCGSGWDLGLNEVGLAQAKDAAIQLKKNPLKIKRMISSPELRTVQMADIIHDQMKVKWVLWRGFSDQLLGDLEGKKIVSGDSASVPIADPLGGETAQKFRERVLVALNEARQTAESTLLVTHSRVAQTVLRSEEVLKPGILVEVFWSANTGDLPSIQVVSLT